MSEMIVSKNESASLGLPVTFRDIQGKCKPASAVSDQPPQKVRPLDDTDDRTHPRIWERYPGWSCAAVTGASTCMFLSGRATVSAASAAGGDPHRRSHARPAAPDGGHPAPRSHGPSACEAPPPSTPPRHRCGPTRRLLLFRTTQTWGQPQIQLVKHATY